MYDDSDPTKAIQWAGYVTVLDPDSSLDAVKLSLATIEAYLDRRYVTDITYSVANGWHRNQLIGDLVTRFAATTTPPGVPFTERNVGGVGPILPKDLVCQNTDNASVLQRINEVISWLGGEWTITWSWSADQQTLMPKILVGDQIGRVSTTGIPTVTFEQPGPIVSVTQPVDYSAGAGANSVTAYSSGQGSVTPYADPVVAADFKGRPTFEYRYQPVASESDTTVLAQHAQQALNVLQNGAQPLSLVLALEGDNGLELGRRLGSDWDLGDSVGYNVEPCPAFPDGLTGVARVIAYEITLTTITPIFAQPEVYTGGGA
jgi:hypothetical protein